MNIQEARDKIGFVQQKLIEMKNITAFVDDTAFEENTDTGYPLLESDVNMGDAFPKENTVMQNSWEDIKKNAPPGFSFDSLIIRHLSFNQAHDWYDITQRDIPRELVKIEEYKKKLFLVEYLETLHPEINRVTEIIINGDLDAALKTVFSTFDAKIRERIKAKPGENTIPTIGKAFKEGILSAPQPENNDSARNFLQGVLGYYRNTILHNPLPANRNNLNMSLSLFALAHEAYILFDSCSKDRS